MRREDIEALADTVSQLSPRMWAWARMVGEARTSSNDARRLARSDRGAANTQVDLVGSLGELHLLSSCAGLPHSADAVAYMQRHLYSPDGGRGVTGPDLAFRPDGGASAFAVDVKTFDCSPYKRHFAINDQKHRELAGSCTAYFCVVVPPLGRCMAVARLVPYEDVESWPVFALGSYGSPSRNLPLSEFLETYFTATPSIEDLRRHRIDEAEARNAFRDPAVRSALRELVPALAAS